jgi:hypothetical protein
VKSAIAAHRGRHYYPLFQLCFSLELLIIDNSAALFLQFFLFAPPLPSAKAGKASVSVSRSAAVPAALNEFLENAAGRVGL